MTTKSLTIRFLKKEDNSFMHAAFLEAFSDYVIPFKLSKEQFIHRFVDKLTINFELSVGAFSGNKLVGFIFTAINNYQDKTTAYNGGTGVIHAFRGKNLTKRMYDFLTPELRKHKIEQYVLEVITSNERAIRAYQNCGFSVNKKFSCFALRESFQTRGISTKNLKLEKPDNFDWALYEEFRDISPSFLDCPPILRQNIAQEQIIYLKEQEKVLAYGIFQPQTGRLSQIAVAKSQRRKGLGRRLIQEMFQLSIPKCLTISNIDSQAISVISFFEAMGFVNEIDQYEMTMVLD
ncbi:GNAT family N-acetyltransferase [Xanthovirga aplysinae]|uniref:GNAT family N-acetyltransferase n=1 Tax=Xanthovirga aplysinae TaxID=2529853 RepID=UPI0012BD28A7|nr:GNAT family N-acetyltransferase [Xanthovirga aplysinae]MTI31919.1 GNAT family N-acetyltransferase [Xanthovirga aplysinae]